MLKIFSGDIRMEFGLEKTFIKERSTSMSEIKLDESTNIRELDQENIHKYLGIDEGKEI